MTVRILLTVISIHALVKRATRFIVYIITYLCISIHALVKRATPQNTTTALRAGDFNPRPREEGDKRLVITQIHTFNFNPRPREEGDGGWVYVAEGKENKFQSTPS